MRQRAVSAPLVAAALLLVAACAGRPSPVVSAPSPTPRPDANALIRAGCFRCLEEAFTAASASAVQDTAAPPTTAFEAAVLLVSRSKDLGLPPDGWLDEARRLLPGPEWTIYLDIVSAQALDPMSADRDVAFEQELALRRQAPPYDTWRGSLAAGPGSPVLRAYLDLTIACRDGRTEPAAVRDAATAAVLRQFGAEVPLLQYRIGLCGGREAGQLATLRQLEPRFVDAELELARRDLAAAPRPDVESAMRRLALAREAFPASPLIPMMLGNCHQGREQWSEALQEFDAALTLVPTHRDAMLGRVIALSQSARHDDAIATATRLIDLGDWLLGQAYYWRAWNVFLLDRVEEARVDADRAKTLMVNAAVYLLSGMIEWGLKRPQSAEREFAESLAMDAGYCEAASYLGGVRLELRTWAESLAGFEHAQRCFDLAIVLRRQAITGLSTTPDDEAANAWQIAAHQRAIVSAERRRTEAVQNVAAIQKFLAASPR